MFITTNHIQDTFQQHIFNKKDIVKRQLIQVEDECIPIQLGVETIDILTSNIWSHSIHLITILDVEADMVSVILFSKYFEKIEHHLHFSFNKPSEVIEMTDQSLIYYLDTFHIV